MAERGEVRLWIDDHHTFSEHSWLINPTYVRDWRQFWAFDSINQGGPDVLENGVTWGKRKIHFGEGSVGDSNSFSNSYILPPFSTAYETIHCRESGGHSQQSDVGSLLVRSSVSQTSRRTLLPGPRSLLFRLLLRCPQTPNLDLPQSFEPWSVPLPHPPRSVQKRKTNKTLPFSLREPPLLRGVKTMIDLGWGGGEGVG